jgi:hypothetical protein
LHPDGVPTGTEIVAILSTCDPPAQSDETLIGLWLDGRSAHTRRAYAAAARFLLAAAGKPVAALTLIDLQAWIGSLAELAPTSRARIGAVKSLLSFGERTGYLPFNVGAAVRVPPVKNILGERILEENDVIRLIALESDPRLALGMGYSAPFCDIRDRTIEPPRRVDSGPCTSSHPERQGAPKTAVSSEALTQV